MSERGMRRLRPAYAPPRGAQRVALIVDVRQAKAHLSRLLERVRQGEEVVIAKAGQPVARLVPVLPQRARRVPGSAQGLVQIGADFDAPLPEEVLRGFEQ